MPALPRLDRGLPVRAWQRVLDLVSPAVSVVHDVELVNPEYLPTDGAVVVACAWASPLDPLTASLGLPRRARQIELDRHVGALPLPSEEETTDVNDVDAVSRAVDQGQVLLVFPEAEPSPDGLVHRGRIGLGELVLRHRLPVLPAAVIEGRLVLGEALDFSRHFDLEASRPIARAVTDEVMAAVVIVADRGYHDTTAAGARRDARNERQAAARARRQRAADRRRAELEAKFARREAAAEERADLRQRAERAEAEARARVAAARAAAERQR